MLDPANTVLVFIDVQGNLAQAMYGKEDLFDNLKKLIAGITVLEVPIVWTEQNPEKLGPTLPEIAELMPDNVPISKMSFSCCANNEFMRALEACSRKQVLIAGIEAHVCVYQTTVDLVSIGYTVQVVADCVASRTRENKTIGLDRIKSAGAGLTSTEIVLFELLKTADAPQFKQIAKIVK